MNNRGRFSPLHISWFAHLFLLALTMVACSRAQADPRADLVIAVPKGVEARALEAAAAVYAQAGGPTVHIEAMGTDLYTNQAAAALLAGLDRYDLVYLSADTLPKWIDYHALQPLDAPADRSVLEPWLAQVEFDGRLYAVPTQPDPVVFWYRADLLSTAGLPVPTDWETFRRAAQALNNPPDRYSVAIPGSDMDAAADFAGVLAGFGGQAVNAGNEVMVSEPPARQALAFYAGLSAVDRVASPKTARFTRADVLAELRAGRAAMGIAPLSASALLRDCSAKNPVCQGAEPQLAFAPLPGVDQQTAVGSLSAWAIPLHAAHAEQARRFAAWLGGAEGARAWAQNGGIPAHHTVLRELAQAGGTDGTAILAPALVKIQKFQLALPGNPNSEMLWKAYNTAVHTAVAGEMSPDQALEDAAAKMRTALRQNGFESSSSTAQ